MRNGIKSKFTQAVQYDVVQSLAIALCNRIQEERPDKIAAFIADLRSESIVLRTLEEIKKTTTEAADVDPRLVIDVLLVMALPAGLKWRVLQIVLRRASTIYAERTGLIRPRAKL
eukprot:TRINITY_DN4538_c0_g2_i1.p1 TRINITY_DN4538_c0_g2~~TRINITY_DN4538_c0_g2_i1.p1  ORF type:complete len:131 (+),score=22.37 TRINITY_DN4538_c0_g2_i1:51-395(+)